MKKLFIVVILGFLTACNSENSEKTNKGSEENSSQQAFAQTDPTPGPINFIEKDTANVMIESYLESIEKDPDALKSLIVNANDLRQYLSDTSIKQVKLMFAHTESYIRKGNRGVPCGYNSNALTIILAGYDASENYKYYDVNKVLDHCMPCPSMCPVNGTAQYNTFPQ